MKSTPNKDEPTVSASELNADAALPSKPREALPEAPEDQRIAAVKQIFNDISANNSKEAEKKKLENEDFADAIDMACLLSEIRLTIHFSKMIERIIEAARDQEIQLQRTERNSSNAAPANPYPVVLPQKNQTPEEYKTKIIAEVRAVLADIQTRQKDIKVNLLNKEN